MSPPDLQKSEKLKLTIPSNPRIRKKVWLATKKATLEAPSEFVPNDPDTDAKSAGRRCLK